MSNGSTIKTTSSKCTVGIIIIRTHSVAWIEFHCMRAYGSALQVNGKSLVDLNY